MSLETQNIYEFEDFRLDVAQKTLSRSGEVVPLTPKVFETLQIFVENSGRLIEKDEMMQRIWQDRFVEESNLSFNIKMLRKALGDNGSKRRFIETVPKRGYRFVSSVTRVNKPETHLAVVTNLAGKSDSSNPTASRLIQATGTTVPNVIALADWQKEPQEETWDATEKPAKLELVPAVTPKKRFAGTTLIFAAAIGLVILAVLAFKVNSFFSVAASSFDFASANRLTTNGNTIDAAISPDGKFLAYVVDKDGEQSLWMKNIATKTDLQIVQPPKGVFLHNLLFSGSGDNIFYVANGLLFQVSILGGTPVKVVENGSISFSLSPDGKHIAFFRNTDETSDIIVTELESGLERILASSRQPEVFLRYLTWSPDGQMIVCSALDLEGYQRVVYVNVSDGVVRSIPSTKYETIFHLAWHPTSGDLLVSATDGSNSFFAQIWSLDIQTGEARKLTRDSKNYERIRLTADGSSLVAVRQEITAHIWMVNSGEATGRQLTKGFEKFEGIYGLEWTKNDKIVYEIPSNASTELWHIGPDGRGEQRIASDVGVTAVAPDSSFAIYQGTDSDGTGLFRLNIDNGKRQRLTKGTDIWADISPDGKWVVFTRYGDDTSIWKIPSDGGSAAKLCETEGWAVTPAFSPDGRYVAFYLADSRYEIALAEFDTGKVVSKFKVFPQFFQTDGRNTLRWTADGQAFDYAVYQNGVSNIWRQPIDGSPAFQITNFDSGRIFNFAYSPDRKQLALSRGSVNSDAVLISISK